MSQHSNKIKWWETTPLDQMSSEQWEAVCDGCGKCCMLKVWQGSVVKTTRIGCELLDIKTGRCSDYDNRLQTVKNCRKVTYENLDTPGLLPDSCAYILLKNGKPLHDWHHLISGDRNTVIEQGHSVVGFAKATRLDANAAKLQKYFLEAVDYFDQK